MKCREIMKHRYLNTIAPDDPISKAVEAMRVAGVGMLPVCTSDSRVVGVLTDRDIALRAVKTEPVLASPVVRDLMVSRLVWCRPEDDLDRAERLMRKHGKHRMLILDDEQHLLGVLTITDIAQHEEPLRAARLMRDVTARHYRHER